MKFVYFLDKKLTFQYFFYFFLRCELDRRFYFLFFFLRRGQKDPCRSSSTKQYTECGLIWKIFSTTVALWDNSLRACYRRSFSGFPQLFVAFSSFLQLFLPISAACFAFSSFPLIFDRDFPVLCDFSLGFSGFPPLYITDPLVSIWATFPNFYKNRN